MLCLSVGMLHRPTHLIPGIKYGQKFLTYVIPGIRYVAWGNTFH